MKIKHRDCFTGDGNYHLALHLLNRGCLEHYSVSWWAHEGTTEHSGVYFYTEEDQAKNQNRPEFTLSVETSSNFLSLNIQ